MISEHNIKLAVGNENFEKGRILVKLNRVLSAAVMGNNASGRVASGDGRVFFQSIEFLGRGSINHYGAGYCTCIDSHSCQHVAAVLLQLEKSSSVPTPADEASDSSVAALQEDSKPEKAADSASAPKKTSDAVSAVDETTDSEPIVEPVPDEYLPPSSIDDWLRELKRELNNAVRSSSARTPANPASDAILYILDRDHDGNPVVESFVARKSRGVNLELTNRRFQYSEYFYEHDVLTTEDVGILAKLNFWQKSRSSRSINWPESQSLKNFLQELTATNRLRTRSRSKKPLQWGPVKKIKRSQLKTYNGQSFVRIGGKGKKRTRFIQLYRFPDLIYVDQKTHIIGQIEILQTPSKEDEHLVPAKQQKRKFPYDGLIYVFKNIDDADFYGSYILAYEATFYASKPPKVKSKFNLSTWTSTKKRLLTAEDISILARIKYLWDRKYTPHIDPPSLDSTGKLKQDIVQTGRLRDLNSIETKFKWGPSEIGHFEWIIDTVGDQKLMVVMDDLEMANTSEVFMFELPIYMNVKAGLAGVVDLNTSLKLIELLCYSPPLTPFGNEEIKAKLAAIKQYKLPLPQSFDSRALRTGLNPTPLLTLHGRIFEKSRSASKSLNFSMAADSSPHTLVPCARLEILYEGVEHKLIPNLGKFALIKNEEETVFVARDLSAEFDAEDSLRSYGYTYCFDHVEDFEFEYLNQGYDYDKFHISEFIFYSDFDMGNQASNMPLRFFEEVVPKLLRKGWQVDIQNSWPGRYFEGETKFSANAEFTGDDWFSLMLNLEVNGTPMDIRPLIQDIIAKLPLDRSGNLADDFEFETYLQDAIFYQHIEDETGLSVLPVRGKQIAGFVKAFFEAHNLYQFHRAEAGRLANLVDTLSNYGAPWEGGKKLLSLGKKLVQLSEQSAVPQPQALQGTLRPYQQIGYGWLKALSQVEYGGVLADDMGLGKTIQALALLQHRHIELEAERPSLLVAPTSLLSNWIREAARFTPDLKLLRLQGTKRKDKFCEISDHHLILSTYPLINRDFKELFAHEYELVILDEAQHIKNPLAKVSRRIREVKANQRVALTGTPLENNLGELWALYDWLIPGVLGKRKAFNKNFRKPIEKDGDQMLQRQLNARLKPFLLRRTKEEVAQDLPPKTEINEVIPLTSDQRALYESIRLHMDERIRDAINERGMERSSITILDALLKLRQVCCDPALVKMKAAKQFHGSAKRQRLAELLESLILEDRKVLIFSQFVQMLRLIEKDVQANKWTYAMLHGQTKKRDEQIDKFQHGDAQLFLISLKAGGLGLNLTAADTVILYDPWWNPAVERQAMDRAHRIGQDKPVFVYRLISEGTVESTIQEMQKRKQALADALFAGGGTGALSLTEEDIDSLLAPIA